MLRRNKPTNKNILVYIKQDPVDEVVKRPIIQSSDGTSTYVVIEPETEKKAGWKVDITGCVRVSKNGLYVEAIRGATKAIKIDVENKSYTLSKLTNDEQQAFINLKIFKAHYGKLLGDLLSALKPYLIVLAVLVVIAIAVSGYNTYTISKLPTVFPNTTTSTYPGVIG